MAVSPSGYGPDPRGNIRGIRSGKLRRDCPQSPKNGSILSLATIPCAASPTERSPPRMHQPSPVHVSGSVRPARQGGGLLVYRPSRPPTPSSTKELAIRCGSRRRWLRRSASPFPRLSMAQGGDPGCPLPNTDWLGRDPHQRRILRRAIPLGGGRAAPLACGPMRRRGCLHGLQRSQHSRNPETARGTGSQYARGVSHGAWDLTAGPRFLLYRGTGGSWPGCRADSMVLEIPPLRIVPYRFPQTCRSPGMEDRTGIIGESSIFPGG